MWFLWLWYVHGVCDLRFLVKLQAEFLLKGLGIFVEIRMILNLSFCEYLIIWAKITPRLLWPHAGVPGHFADDVRRWAEELIPEFVVSATPQPEMPDAQH